MKKTSLAIWVVGLSVPAALWAADESGPMISLPLAPAPAKVPSTKVRDIGADRREGIVTWIRQKVPACSAEAAAAAAAAFLEELQDRHPDQLERTSDGAFRLDEFESSLLRQVAAALPATGYDALREDLAKQRAQALAARRNLGNSISANAVLGSIRSLSETRYRSLLDGRMEDDDLAFYLKRTANKDGQSPTTTNKVSGEKSVGEIVAEFARRNQKGAALRQWRAYLMEVTLKPAAGGEQQLVIAKMRPDRFRLSVSQAGRVQLVQASDGHQFWQQVPGGGAQVLSTSVVGSRRYLGEFVDPLFGEEGYVFERLDDGGAGENRFYRIAVQRPDGSKYISQIGTRTFQEIGREEADGSVAKFSDFREIAGVTFAFHEEVVDHEGRKAGIQVTRLVANPGLIADYFAMPPNGDQGFFLIESTLPPVAEKAPNAHP